MGNYLGCAARWALVCLALGGGAGCAAAEDGESPGARASAVVYGSDDRVPYSAVTDARLRGWADATAALFIDENVSCAEAACSLTTRPIEAVTGALCDGQPLQDQAVGAACTAFLIAPDVMVTAGHCLEDCRFGEFPAREVRFVFGFQTDTRGEVPREVPAENVYRCAEMLGRDMTGMSEADRDFAVFRLDRPVTGRTPLVPAPAGTRVSEDASLVILGHPRGVPLMVAAGGRVTANDATLPRFYSSLDHLPGNSGSPVLDAATGLVHGILVTTPATAEFDTVFTPTGDLCLEERVCDEALGCGGYLPSSSWAGVMRIGAASACRDGQKDGLESDVDCGGAPECVRCAEGRACSADLDCTSGRCAAGVCAVPYCEDGVRDHGESDVDCGAGCATACAVGLRCSEHLDCQSNSCVHGRCAQPSCVDGRYNGDETDVDCGGPCKPCRVGQGCSADSECRIGVCDFGTCIAPTCPDGVLDGAETGVDCGGGCFPCAEGVVCTTNDDCSSGSCKQGRCVKRPPVTCHSAKPRSRRL
ncbi:MAG TPA: serine protease [Polyangiaceae bacterium]|nr:serine protease [Polyangiaceae bacterium]